MRNLKITVLITCLAFSINSYAMDIDNPEINSATATTQSVYDNSKKVATTEYVDSMSLRKFYWGTFAESFDALATSDGVTVTMSLEQSGGGDLTMQFSDGNTTFDSTPAATIALTAGSDNSPTKNFVYILQSDKSLSVSTSGWATAEHIKVGFFYIPSAGTVQTDGGGFVNQNWNDELNTSDNIGHMAHITQRLRLMGAQWNSGIDGNGTDGYLTPTASNVEFKSTSGVIFQMHEHGINAHDTSTGDIVLVKNWFGDAYHSVTNLFDITADSTGATIGNNKWFNLYLWLAANKTGQYSPIVINLPSGFYNTQAGAQSDSSGYDDSTIPDEFDVDSSTGLLFARVTIKMGTTWVVGSTVDLRKGNALGITGGAFSNQTEFADNVFNVFNVSDVTKIAAFDASGITTGTTRTYTFPDQSDTLVVNNSSPQFVNTNISSILTAASIQAFALIGKLTAGSNEIEGSNFDINGGDISAATISGGLTWSAAQNLNSQALTNVNIDSGSIDAVTIGTNSAATELQVDDININSETISNAVAGGNVILQAEFSGSDDGVVIIPKGTSGATLNTTNYTLIIDSQADNAINILTPNTGTGGFVFGDEDDVDVAAVLYDHSDNHMYMRVNNSADEAVTITSAGRLGVSAPNPSRLVEFGHATMASAAYLALDAAAGHQKAIEFNSAGVQKWVMYNPPSSGDIRWFSGADRMILGTGGAFFLKSIGGVGAVGSLIRYNTTTGEINHQTSSQRYKTPADYAHPDILNRSINFIETAKVAKYDYLDGSVYNKISLMAEDVHAVEPALVYHKMIDGELLVEGYSDPDIVPFLIKYVQYLNARIEALER